LCPYAADHYGYARKDREVVTDSRHKRLDLKIKLDALPAIRFVDENRYNLGEATCTREWQPSG
jgi:hypothetical protein